MRQKRLSCPAPSHPRIPRLRTRSLVKVPKKLTLPEDPVSPGSNFRYPFKTSRFRFSCCSFLQPRMSASYSSCRGIALLSGELSG